MDVRLTPASTTSVGEGVDGVDNVAVGLEEGSAVGTDEGGLTVMVVEVVVVVTMSVEGTAGATPYCGLAMGCGTARTPTANRVMRPSVYMVAKL